MLGSSQAGGLYNGILILSDTKTGTFWDHITGVGVYGPLAGKAMPAWNVEMTTAQAAAASHPDAQLLVARTSIMHRLFTWVPRLFVWTGWLPPVFMKSIGGEEDKRLPRFTMGLGVVSAGTVKREARFYPPFRMREGAGQRRSDPRGFGRQAAAHRAAGAQRRARGYLGV